jgi:ribA/ribD-fused uncharacterized protein
VKKINSFQGDYRFLSNFWPCSIQYQQLLYPTVEHAYQAAKVENLVIKEKIKDCPTPAAAKDFFKNHQIKPDQGWTVARKLLVMEELLTLKFGGQEPFLTRALLATSDAVLIEGNTWGDTFWGVYDNIGENHLGQLLMKVRAALVLQKEQIIHQLTIQAGNAAIANFLSITERQLYEKMMAFRIPNKEYWIS